MFIWLQVKLLEILSARSKGSADGQSPGASATNALGDGFLDRIFGKTVVDFGCGEGGTAVELALAGAGRVIGIDIRDEVLDAARQRAQAAGVGAICEFTRSSQERADIVVSLDAFEHFEDPAAVLEAMHGILKPGGEVVASFGPTWYHPLGGHLFSVFPWAHVILSEKALIKWRSGFRTDGATRFGEVAGGLNQMTIRRFERIVAESPLKFASLEAKPIRKLQWLHGRLTREFTTAVVRCRLVKKAAAGAVAT